MDPATLSDWKSTRAEFGFDSSTAHLEDIANATDTNTNDIGVPLSPTEQSEMTRRQSLGKVVGAIDGAGKGSALYGGVLVDQAAGGVVTIKIVNYGSSDDAAALAKSLVSLVPSEDPSTVISAKYSQNELDAADAAFQTALSNGELKKFKFASEVISDGVMRIGIDASADDSAEAGLTKLFPWPFVSITRVSDHSNDFQNRDRTSGPLYGGEWMGHNNGSTYTQCTVGYSLMRADSGSSNRFTATAGHCGPSATRWYQGQTGEGNYFGMGTGNQGTYGSNRTGTTSKCDCQVIGPIPLSAATHSVLIDNDVLFAFSHTPTNTSADYYVGRSVCFAGGTFATAHPGHENHCSTIRSVNATQHFSPNDVDFTNLGEIEDGASLGGDSGAPFGSGSDFMGLLGGLLPNDGYRTWFSRSTYIDAFTGAYPSY